MSADHRIAALASRQHGVVSRTQLFEISVTRRQIEGRLNVGRLRPLHRGVYLVGVVAPPRARETAAVLACAPDALVSHVDAAALWELRPPVPDTWPVNVAVQDGDRGRRPGIRPHRVRRLYHDEVSEVDGIPVTSPARTLLDLAADERERVVERALAEAERRGLVTEQELDGLLARRSGHRGARRLRFLLERQGEPALTESEAEELFLGLVRRADLPSPKVNAVIGRYRLDFLWPRERLAVEVDGYEFHKPIRRFNSDRRRDARLLATEGIQILRVTWHQLSDEPEAVLGRLALALGRARGEGRRA